jgi:hypothetical protein
MRYVYLFFLLLPGFSFAQTTSQTSFGKNRVQYHRQFDDWLHYESPHFDTYWYGDARNVAQAALQFAEYDFEAIQKLLEHQMTARIEVLVFIDLSDLKQSNIGEDEIFKLKAGETKVVGNKIFAFFDGNHLNLRKQLREGIAGVVLNSMLFGANLQEIVQNAVLLNLPGWYTNGLLAYCGEEWSEEQDDALRDLVLSEKYSNFDKLALEHPRLAGHAFWYYIGLNFGKGTVSNLLYLTRINRSVDAGFLYVLGSGYDRTSEALMEYFKQRYQEEALYTSNRHDGELISFKNKRNLPITQLKLSPDGKRLIWVTNDIGKWKVWHYDIATEKRTCLLKGGVRNAQQTADLNYPLLAWHPDNQQLAVLYEQKDELLLKVIAPQTKESSRAILAPDYQRIFSMEYINPGDLLFSAAVQGYSDLFIYHTVNRQTERLTQDFWDDLDASITELDGHKGVLFSSNRISDTLKPQKMDTILPLGPFDVFFLDLQTRSPVLRQITFTPDADERLPRGTSAGYFSYMSDASGILNRQAGYLEPYTAFYQTIFYLNDGAEVRSLNMDKNGEWPTEKALGYLAPEDSVRVNIDSTTIDSIRVVPFIQKRAKTYNQTNYNRNLINHSYSADGVRQAEQWYQNGQTHIQLSNYDPKQQKPVWITRHQAMNMRSRGQAVVQEISEPLNEPVDDDQSNFLPEPLPEIQNNRDSVIVIDPGAYFQVPEHLSTPNPVVEKAKVADPETEVPERKESQPKAQIAQEPARKPAVEFGKDGSVIKFMPSRIVAYRLRFRTDYISTSMDNNLLFEGLDSYAGSPNGFQTPPPGVLFKANLKDLLEDYVLEAGFRLPTTFNGAEYYLWFDNKKRRIDKRVALYRKTLISTLDPGQIGNPAGPTQVRTNTLLGQYELRYPLNTYTSIRGTFTLRQDKAITLTTNAPTLEAPDYAEQRASFRLSTVYDNTVDIDMNLRTGTRAKVFVEAVKRFEFNTQPNWSLKFNSGFMTVVGLDARHYQRLDRRSILAMRLAGATTFGSERILYFLGGVDNWVFPKFNNNIPIPQDGNFAYQTLAANLRGFRQNIRNGSSYALFNSELRVPIFKYFSRKPVMSNFWRSFQLVGFFDAGTAWQGRTPYSGDNPLNTVVVENPPTVSVKVNYFRDPLVAGYGVGLRSLLFGMHIRLDYAWGIETRVVQKPMLHVALGTDF